MASWICWACPYFQNKLLVPYTTRHTFAAWSLTLGMSPEKLVTRMGHGSKKMIYEVYGKYVKELEKDAGKILEYFGSDFIDL